MLLTHIVTHAAACERQNWRIFSPFFHNRFRAISATGLSRLLTGNLTREIRTSVDLRGPGWPTNWRCASSSLLYSCPMFSGAGP